MALDVTPISEYMSRGADLSNKMLQTKLNMLFGRPEREAQLQQSQMQNAFYPLQQAVSAQNALSYSNMKGGPASTYLRAIQAMPAKQREAYLSYPENMNKFKEVTQMLQSEMQQPGIGQNFLIPEMINSLMQRFMPQMQQQPQQPMQGQQPGMGQQIQNPMQQAPQQAPQQAMNIPTEEEIVVPEKPYREPGRKIEANASNINDFLSGIESAPVELVNMKNINDSNISTKIKDRRDGAVAIDKWLMDNRDDMKKALKLASKYSSYWGLAGRKKDEFLSSLMNKNPKGYEDLVWYETTFVPNISNGIKVMENLSATNDQRKELHEMGNALTNPKLNNKQAINVMNKQIQSIMDVSDSVFKAAEPIHKGVTRKMYDLPHFKGNYIDVEDNEDIKATKPSKTYSQRLEKPILELIKSGGLTKEYYSKLSPEQKAAARRALEISHNA